MSWDIRVFISAMFWLAVVFSAIVIPTLCAVKIADLRIERAASGSVE